MGTALQFALLAMQLAAAASEHLEWGTAKVQHFVETGTDPTAEDWADINARTATLRDRLHQDKA